MVVCRAIHSANPWRYVTVNPAKIPTPSSPSTPLRVASRSAATSTDSSISA